MCFVLCRCASPGASRNINIIITVFARNGVSIYSGSGGSPPHPLEAFVDEYMERRENNAGEKDKIRKPSKVSSCMLPFLPRRVVAV